MRGGLVFFRGEGAAARAYLESDHSHADEYYLEHGAATATWRSLDARGSAPTVAQLDGEQYQAWVDWNDPLTGERKGTPRAASRVREDGSIKALPSSPRFVEMTVNGDKSLSVAAALSPEVSAALDEAQQAAVDAMDAYMAEHSVTRVGPLGAQRLVPVERLESVAVVHRSSRAGDPHRHVHVQWSTRVFAEGKWRGMHTAATLKQQGALRGVGEAAIHNHAGLRAALAKAGFVFDASRGEVVNLREHARVMSKRATQIERNVAAMERDWRAANPGAEPDQAQRRRWDQQAWAHERPRKRRVDERPESKWIDELRGAGLQVDGFAARAATPLAGVASLDRDALRTAAIAAAEARRSAWSLADVEGYLGVEVGKHEVAATPDEVRGFVRDLAQQIVGELPRLDVDVDGIVPEWVRQYTSDRVLHVEETLRGAFLTRGLESGMALDASPIEGLNAQQAAAARAIATRAPLVVIEGAAGSGKTTMLGAARRLADEQGVRLVVVAPTLRAAQEAASATGAQASSAHKLAHEYGFRWTAEGQWSRLAIGEPTESGQAYAGPSAQWALDADARIVVDEAGMTDHDLAYALVTIADETGAGLALVGDRQQLPAVGRGGVLDMAVAAHPHPLDMAEVHRFREAGYAELSHRLRARTDPTSLFDVLHSRGNIVVHADASALREHLVSDVVAKATAGASVAVAVASNEDAAEVNALVQDAHARAGHTRTATVDVAGSDGLTLRIGDRMMTRKNDGELGVANRDVWTVQRVHRDGSVSVRDGARTARLPRDYVEADTHLAYASTVYGVQGASVDYAHGIVDDSTSAQSLYVAATRGREHNAMHVVAEDVDGAREMFVDAIGRESGDRGTAAAADVARRDLSGLDLAAAPSVDDAVRAERMAAEQRRYEAQAREWRIARDRWMQQHPGADPEGWETRLDVAVTAAVSAEQDVAAVRRDVVDVGVRDRMQSWSDDWRTLDAARQERERASLLTRRKAEQRVTDLEAAFAARQKAEAAPRPSEAVVERWKAEATAPGVSAPLDAATARAAQARADADAVEGQRPPFGAEPRSPRVGSPEQEAEKDAYFVQRQQQRAAKRAKRVQAQQQTPTRGEPTLER